MKSSSWKKKANLQRSGIKAHLKPKVKCLSLSMTISKSRQSGWKASWKPFEGKIVSESLALPSLGQLTVFSVISSGSNGRKPYTTICFLNGKHIYPVELLRLVHGLRGHVKKRVLMKVKSIILKPAICQSDEKSLKK